MSRLTALAVGVAMLGLGMGTMVRAEDVKNKGDAEFIKEAASGGMLEVKLGQLATERGMLTEVRQFGERMVKDHSKANQELLAVAQERGIKVDKELNAKDQETFDKFRDLKGVDFDRAYIKHMVKDHEHDVAEFKKMTKDGKDDQVRAFAVKTLPVIEDHLKMAREINEKLERK